jgi:hypothetical protein
MEGEGELFAQVFRQLPEFSVGVSGISEKEYFIATEVLRRNFEWEEAVGREKGRMI